LAFDSEGFQSGLDAAAASQRMRISMGTLQDSLLSACMFSEKRPLLRFSRDSDGDFASLSFVARLPSSFLRSGKFGDLVMRRVSFTVENGPDSRKQLVLRQNPILMEPDKNEVENPLVLAKDVNSSSWSIGMQRLANGLRSGLPQINFRNGENHACTCHLISFHPNRRRRCSVWSNCRRRRCEWNADANVGRGRRSGCQGTLPGGVQPGRGGTKPLPGQLPGGRLQ